MLPVHRLALEQWCRTSSGREGRCFTHSFWLQYQQIVPVITCYPISQKQTLLTIPFYCDHAHFTPHDHTCLLGLSTWPSSSINSVSWLSSACVASFPWYYITFSWQIFLPRAFLPSNLCQNGNPETGFSLLKEKKNSPYCYSLLAVFTFSSWCSTFQADNPPHLHINPGLLPYKTGHCSQKGQHSFISLPCACLIFFLEGNPFIPSLYVKHFL